MTNTTNTQQAEVFGYQIRKFQHPRSRRLLQIAAGEIFIILGITLFLKAELGIPPWAVFHQGISKQLSISYGTVVLIISLLLLVLFRYTKQPLGIGTLIATFVVGPGVDLLLFVFPDMTTSFIRFSAISVSPIIFGLGAGLYLGANLGPGPRDSLMTGLAQRGLKISTASRLIEATVLFIGWALGGNVGIGTVWHALSVGWAVRFFLRRFTI